MNYTIRTASEDEIERVDAQTAVSYKRTYKGMMDKAYINSLSNDPREPILMAFFNNGDSRLIMEMLRARRFTAKQKKPCLSQSFKSCAPEVLTNSRTINFCISYGYSVSGTFTAEEKLGVIGLYKPKSPLITPVCSRP